MRRLLGFFVLLAVGIYGVAAAKTPPVIFVSEGGSLGVELQVSADRLRVDLLNSSDRAIKVNKRFLYGTESGWTDLVLVVQDEGGNILPYLTKATSERPRPEDWCYLSPGNFVGKSIPLKRLKADYGLENKMYTVRVEYLIRSKKGELLSRLSSPSVSVSFQLDE